MWLADGEKERENPVWKRERERMKMRMGKEKNEDLESGTSTTSSDSLTVRAGSAGCGSTINLFIICGWQIY